MVDINKLAYRDIGRQIAAPGEKPVHPQIVKNVIKKLKSEGLVSDGEITANTARLVSIPVLGVANAGPATHIAGSNDRGTIQVSASLLPSTNYDDFYALEVDGESMNRALIRGNTIQNKDYVIIDGSKKIPHEGDIVTVVYEGLANIKKVHFDFKGELVVLYSQSTQDFQPIVINPQDSWEGLIGGTVIYVVKRPKGSHPLE